MGSIITPINIPTSDINSRYNEEIKIFLDPIYRSECVNRIDYLKIPPFSNDKLGSIAETNIYGNKDCFIAINGSSTWPSSSEITKLIDPNHESIYIERKISDNIHRFTKQIDDTESATAA